MSLALDDRWVWDSWLVDNEGIYHLFFLNAPKSLGNPDLRHRHAVIGHAISEDLIHWKVVDPVIGPGAADEFDATATWTGSVVADPSGRWTLFYTGSRFTDPEDGASIQSVGVAHSEDLRRWVKSDRPHVVADPRWYEKATDPGAVGEAWRDPWVFREPSSELWHMLTVARSRRGDDPDDRGVIGHSTSLNLVDWTVREPLTTAGAGFFHLEVPSIATVEGHRVLIFSCFTEHLSGTRRAAGEHGGIWAVNLGSGLDAIDPSLAYLVVPERYFCGHVAFDRAGSPVMIAFEATGPDGLFRGSIADPIPLHWSEHDRLEAEI
jgi:beta-fructofuranosidase